MSSPPLKRARFASNDINNDTASLQASEGFDELGLPNVTLCLHLHKQITAACLYIAQDEKLLFFEDSSVDLSALLIEQTSPDFILVSSKADERFVEGVQKLSQARLEVRPAREFQAHIGKAALLELTVISGLYGDLTTEELADDPVRLEEVHPEQRPEAFLVRQPRSPSAHGLLFSFAHFPQSKV
jgi:hypothetical protein